MTTECMEEVSAAEFLAAHFAAGPCPQCGRGIEYHRAVPFFTSYSLECCAEPVPTEATTEAKEAEDVAPLPSIEELIGQGALFVCNNSGGKDSQAMLIELKKIVPMEQIVVIHAHLPEVEWDGTQEHVRAMSGNLPVHMVQAGKTFLGMVEKRGETLHSQDKGHISPWPSPSFRQCTSDLKRGPIEKLVRQICREQGFSIVVNCMGLRAEESTARRDRPVLKFNRSNSIEGRAWFDWLPIHKMRIAEVFATIRNAGQKPHWAYEAGMSRLSCVFCIMASQRDLQTAAHLRPDLLARYVHLERRLGHSMLMPSQKHGRRFLDEVTGVHVPHEIEALAPA